MKKIIITGAYGQLSREILKNKSFEFEIIALSKDQLDLSSINIATTLDAISDISVIINCAAYTKVDMAEKENLLNYAINAIGVRTLAEYSEKNSIKLIHISTDSVFSTDNPFFHNHEHTHNPINAYSRSKSDGEKFLRERMDENFWIIRTSWLYGDSLKGFVPAILEKVHSRERFGVVDDQFGQPTWTRHLSDFILMILKESLSSGIYHFCSKDFTSRFSFAQKIAQSTGADPNLIYPIETISESGIAVRPRYSLLSTELESRFLSQNSLRWERGIEEFFAHNAF